MRYRGFRSLRVINEDYVQPGYGFPEHDHQNMEIVTYVLSGTLEHRDSMGNGEQIRPGDVQRMTAGSGITHSEANPSATEMVHLLQIWLLPERPSLEPSYEQKHFPVADRQDRLRLVASRRWPRRFHHHPSGRRTVCGRVVAWHDGGACLATRPACLAASDSRCG